MTDKPKKKRVSGKGARDKGLNFERELIAFLSSNLGIQLARGVAGAQAFDKAKGSTDIFGMPHLAVEAKRTETFNMRQFMEQTTRNAGVDIPLIVHRYSRQSMEDSNVVLSLENFLRIYRAYLIHEGFLKDDRLEKVA